MKLDLSSILPSLCADELETLFDQIFHMVNNKTRAKNANHEIICREKEESKACPNCGSHNYVRNGKTKVMTQKYICKDCKKSFSNSTNTMVHYSKKTYMEWKKFIYCEIHQMSLSVTSKEVGISKTTAFHWRHKMHEALKDIVNTINLSGIIQLDALYTGINLKGTVPKNMPRYSKKRKSSALRGISHHKVCIMSGIDDEDNLFLEISGLGKETTQFVREIKHKIVSPSLLITDQMWGFNTIATEWGCDIDQIPTHCHRSERGNSLATLNGIHSEVKEYLRSYRGVSIRHLQGYLDMFVFLKRIKYRIEYDQRVRTTFLSTVPSFCSLKVYQISEKELPIDLRVAYGEYNYGIFNASVI